MEASHKAFTQPKSRVLDFVRLKTEDPQARLFLPGTQAWVPDKEKVFEPATVVEAIEVSQRKFNAAKAKVAGDKKNMKPNTAAYGFGGLGGGSSRQVDSVPNGKLVISKGEKLHLKNVSVKASKTLLPMLDTHLNPSQKLDIFADDLSLPVVMHYINQNFNNKGYDCLQIGERSLVYCNRNLSEDEKIDKEMLKYEAMAEEEENSQDTAPEEEITVKTFAERSFQALNRSLGKASQSCVVSGSVASGRRDVTQQFIQHIAQQGTVNDPVWWDRLQSADKVLTLMGGENFLRWTDMHLAYPKSLSSDTDPTSVRGKLVGTSFRCFLLDTSSLTSPNSPTFRMFYNFCKSGHVIKGSRKVKACDVYFYMNGGKKQTYKYTQSDVDNFYIEQLKKAKLQAAKAVTKEAKKKEKKEKERLEKEKKEKERQAKAAIKAGTLRPKVVKETPNASERKVGKLKNTYQRNLEAQKKKKTMGRKELSKCKFEGCPKDSYFELEYCLDHVSPESREIPMAQRTQEPEEEPVTHKMPDSPKVPRSPAKSTLPRAAAPSTPPPEFPGTKEEWEDTMEKFSLLNIPTDRIAEFQEILLDMLELGNVNVYVDADTAVKNFSNLAGKSLIEDKEVDEDLSYGAKKKIDIYKTDVEKPITKDGVIQNELNAYQDRHKDKIKEEQKAAVFNPPVKFLMDNGDIPSSFFGVNLMDLLEVVNIRMLKVGTEFFFRSQSRSKCEARRDSIIRTLYSGLFNWMLMLINQGISRTTQNQVGDASERIGAITVLESVGLRLSAHLDSSNLGSLEQLIANYAEEKIHTFYTISILEKNAKEWKADSVPISFAGGNEHVLPLILTQEFGATPAQEQAAKPAETKRDKHAKRRSFTRFNVINARSEPTSSKIKSAKNIGILHILEDELRGLQMSSKKLLNRIEKTHKLHKNLALSPTKFSFTIQHFGAKISYDVKSFVKKTMSAVLDEQILEYIVNNTTSDLVKELLTTYSAEFLQKEMLELYEAGKKQIEREIVEAKLRKRQKKSKNLRTTRNTNRFSFRRGKDQGTIRNMKVMANELPATSRSSMNMRRGSIGRAAKGMTMTFNLAGLIRPRNSSGSTIKRLSRNSVTVTEPEPISSPNRAGVLGTALEPVNLNDMSQRSRTKNKRNYDVDTRLRKNPFIQGEQLGKKVSVPNGKSLRSKYDKQKASKKAKTSTMVRDTMNTLVTLLDLTSPAFIFCIGTNEKGESCEKLDSVYVLGQLKLTGVASFIGDRFAECSYGTGIPLPKLRAKYPTISGIIGDLDSQFAPEIFAKRLQNLNVINKGSYKVGSSSKKLYFKQAERYLFDFNVLNKLGMEDLAVFLQKTFRRCFQRKWYWFSLEADFGRKLKKVSAANDLAQLKHLVARCKHYGFKTGVAAAKGKITRLTRDEEIKDVLQSAVESDNILKLYSALQLAKQENIPLCKELSAASSLYGQKTRAQDKLIRENRGALEENFKSVVQELKVDQEVNQEMKEFDVDKWISELKDLKAQQEAEVDEEESSIVEIFTEDVAPTRPTAQSFFSEDSEERKFLSVKKKDPRLRFLTAYQNEQSDALLEEAEDLASVDDFGYDDKQNSFNSTNKSKVNKHFSFSTVGGAQSVQSSEVSEADWIPVNAGNAANTPNSARFMNFTKIISSKVQGSMPKRNGQGGDNNLGKPKKSRFKLPFFSKRKRKESERSIITVEFHQDKKPSTFASVTRFFSRKRPREMNSIQQSPRKAPSSNFISSVMSTFRGRRQKGNPIPA